MKLDLESIGAGLAMGAYEFLKSISGLGNYDVVVIVRAGDEHTCTGTMSPIEAVALLDRASARILERISQQKGVAEG